MLLTRRLQLVVSGGISSKRKPVHQFPIQDLLKIATGGDVQTSIKKRDLLEGFIKTLNILLGHLLFKVVGILDLSLE